MQRRYIALLAFAGLWNSSGLQAQSSQRVNLHVSETAGIRRTAFPVNARVSLARGAIAQPDHARLTIGGAEVPAQYSAESRWPDGSVEWLDVDFNVAIGPAATLDYQLEFGENVKAAEPPRGLAVEGGADFIQVGNIKFSRGGSPLIASVRYRGEEIGKGTNGLFVTDQTGHRFDLSNAGDVTTEILKTGPLFAAVRYSGYINIDSGYQAPFALMVEMPNSKTLVKITAVVIDPEKRLREISIATPLAFSAFPLVWDFGTSRWTYGSMRAITDSVMLTQTPHDWNIVTSSGGKAQLYETSGTTPAGAVRWGHIQDAKEVVAFALESHADQADGAWNIRLEGSGQLAFSYAAASPATEHRMTVYEHFVTTPVQIGAATSPSAILSPLTVTVEPH